ncbi:hypothetical protein TNCV_1771231 [Trichonephila clavipes]|nr:hypothetical protein TNCV_1771231 [Trichonephila clavipes]
MKHVVFSDALIAVPMRLSSNSEGMDTCKLGAFCGIGCTLNSRRATKSFRRGGAGNCRLWEPQERVPVLVSAPSRTTGPENLTVGGPPCLLIRHCVKESRSECSGAQKGVPSQSP